MDLKNSPKIFENYKSDYPQNTIKNVEEGFRCLGLELEYFQNENNGQPDIYSGFCFVKNLPLQSCGKGTTSILAKASAYAEIAERISSGTVLQSFNLLLNRKDLLGNIKFDEEAISRYRYYKFLDGYSYEKIQNGVRNILPEQFLPPIFRQTEGKSVLLKSDISKYHWVYAHSLNRNEKVRIPVKFVSRISGSNGLAAGNTFEEAITQGLCEIFERYCYSHVMHNRLPVPTIDLSSIKNPKIKQQISFYNKHNIDVIIKDFSLGRRFPVVGVLFIDHNIENDNNLLKKDILTYQLNAGASLDLEEAIMRCFTERTQTDINKKNLFSKADIIWKHWVLNMKKSYKNATSFHKEFHQYLTANDLSFLMDERSEQISFGELKNAFQRHPDFYSDIKYLINICNKEKKEVFVVNTMHPKIQFPSVWVIVPEMNWIQDELNTEHSTLQKYSLNDQWFENAEKIKSFIKKTEEHISGNLYYPEINTIYGSTLSLFRILAIANLKIMNKNEALKYFIAAKEIENNNKFDGIIERLKAKDESLIREISTIKNPFIYGWDFKEKAYNEFILPKELNRFLSRY